MHEFPEVQAMVRSACAAAPGKKIRRLTIAIGEASGHNPRHIQEHFLEASRATMAEGAELRFVAESLAARCANCGREFVTAERTFTCANCGGVELDIVAGRDVRLVKVDV